MAYVNVAEWNSDQVAEWLKGLDDVLHPYIHSFVSNNVDGKNLLNLAPDLLRDLNVTSIGHQEIILQGVELLRNIHYHIHQENVQHISLRLSSKARSIYNELCISAPDQNGNKYGDREKEYKAEHDDAEIKKKRERVPTRIVAGVADVLASVKTLVSWLHRTPFHGVDHYDDLKSKFVDISIGLATVAQRDSFAENPVSVIRERCLKLAEIADTIIQDSMDPLILQPASLDVVTVKKRADDNWGLGLLSTYHGIHQISAVRALSPAHSCGKLTGGDQVVQVNYQTVLGWMSYRVTQLMQENPTQVILTVKKCPRHVNTITEIYFKPIRLPSKKRTYSPWNNSVMSPQRYDLQSIPNLQFVKSFDGRSAAQRGVNTEPHPKSMTPPTVGTSSVNATLNSSGSDIAGATASDSDNEESDLDDDAFMSEADYGVSSSRSVRLFQPKPRPQVQRRATIPGATARHTLPFDHILQGYCQRLFISSPVQDIVANETSLFRNKDSGDNRIIRPHTCIGTEKKRTSIPSIKDEEEKMPYIDESDEKEDPDEPCAPQSCDDSSEVAPSKDKGHLNHVAKISSLLSYDSSRQEPLKKRSMTPPKSPLESIEELKIFRRISEERPKLDKSYSSPTYDSDEAVTFTQRKIDLTTKTTATPVKLSHAAEDTLGFQAVPDTNDRDQLAGDCIEEEEDRVEKISLISTSASEGPFSREDPLSSGSLRNKSSSEDFFPVITGVSPKSSLSSLALSTIAITTSVPSFSTNIGGNYGNYVTSSIGAAANENQRSYAPVSCSIPKYVDMSKTVITEILSQYYPNPPERGSNTNPDYINYATNGDGLSADANNCGDGENRSAVSNLSVEDSKSITVNSTRKVDSVSSEVILREGKTNTPLDWRRGIVQNSGNRRISCRELGQGDHHGWLYRRKDSKGFLLAHRWEKRWFILKKNSLYGYRDKDAMKADSLIYLPGFHVCPAPDVKSKRFAFKIYHSSGAAFYFACDTAEERSRWMSQMGLSAISSNSSAKLLENDDKTEEAYYSETDDELEKSPSLQRSPYSPGSREIATTSSQNIKSSSPSPNTRMSPIGSLTSLGTSKSSGLKFLQSSRTALSQPLPTPNFRSYIRVRDSPVARSPSSSGNLFSKEGSPPQIIQEEKEPVNKADMRERKQVRRKGSLRERLKQIPASLTLDRRKNSKGNSPSERSIISPRFAVSSKSESSLSEKSHLQKETSSKSSSQLPCYRRPTHSSTFYTPVKPAAELELYPQRRIASSSPCPLITENLSGQDRGTRRGSIGGLSSESLRSLSPRRGSLDCLVSKGASPSRGSLGSTGSLAAQDEYREGSPEKHWISSLRSNAPKSRSGICVRVQPGIDVITAERLKRTFNYQPPIHRYRTETMQAAFEMNLATTTDNPPNLTRQSKITVSDSSLIPVDRTPRSYGSLDQRPRVPPRTKFLSSDERLLSSTTATISTTYDPLFTNAKSPLGYSEKVSRVKAKAPPSLTLTPAVDEAEAPRTPLKPTMGVAMIGKQRRTPGGISPHEILPHYPGMEYPPTFEPESYSLNIPSTDSPTVALHQKSQNTETRTMKRSPVSLHSSSPISSRRVTSGYVNISHVANTLAEFRGRSYHHNIYVTSPCGGVQSTSTKSCESNTSQEALLNEYVPMGHVNAPTYMNTANFNRS